MRACYVVPLGCMSCSQNLYVDETVCLGFYFKAHCWYADVCSVFTVTLSRSTNQPLPLLLLFPLFLLLWLPDWLKMSRRGDCEKMKCIHYVVAKQFLIFMGCREESYRVIFFYFLNIALFLMFWISFIKDFLKCLAPNPFWGSQWRCYWTSQVCRMSTGQFCANRIFYSFREVLFRQSQGTASFKSHF